MQPNPGLSVDYNRFLQNLDATIPRRSRKNDSGAQLLYKTLHHLKEINPEVSSRLEEFLTYCDLFKRSQYWINEDHQNRYCGVCWLPVAILGKAWMSVVTSLLRFEPPRELAMARRIIITPVALGENSPIKIELRSEIQGVSESTYDHFVKLVRLRFKDIESTFDPDTHLLKITGKRVLQDSEPKYGDSEHPTGGGVPAWLGLLLEMGAVDKVMFSYPLNPRETLETGDFVRGVVVIPACPSEWRKNDTAGRVDSLRTLQSDLGVGPEEPIYLTLTAVEQEWYPLLDEYIKGVISHTALGYALKSEAKPQEASFDTELRLRHLGRHLGLPLYLDIRENTEYRNIYTAFMKSEDQKATWTPVPQVCVAAAEVGPVIQRRLDDISYLTEWARWFKQLATNTANVLEAKALSRNPVNAIPPGKRAPEDFVVRAIESISDFSVFILQSVARTLDLLVSIEGNIAEAQKREDALHSAWTGSEQDPETKNLANSLRYLVNVVLTHDNLHLRCKAMAALVYFLQNDDVLPDHQPGGCADDVFLLSRVLKEPGIKEKVPADLLAWASATIGKIDAVLSRGLQDRIEHKFQTVEKTLLEIATAQSADPTPPKPKTKT